MAARRTGDEMDGERADLGPVEEVAEPLEAAAPADFSPERLNDGQDPSGVRVPLRRLQAEIAKRKSLEEELEAYRAGGLPASPVGGPEAPLEEPDTGLWEAPLSREEPSDWQDPRAPEPAYEPAPPPLPVGDYVSREEAEEMMRQAVQHGSELTRLSFKYGGDRELVDRLLEVGRANPDIVNDDQAYAFLVQTGEIVRAPDAAATSDLNQSIAPIAYQEPVRPGLGRDRAELERDPRHQAAKREAELLHQARSEGASGAPRRGSAGQQLIRERLFKNG